MNDTASTSTAHSAIPAMPAAATSTTGPSRAPASYTPTLSSPSSSSLSDIDVGGAGHDAAEASARKTRAERPRMASRKPSASILVPRDHPEIEVDEDVHEFPPDDARAMSPRRNSADVERLSHEARRQIQL